MSSQKAVVGKFSGAKTVGDEKMPTGGSAVADAPPAVVSATFDVLLDKDDTTNLADATGRNIHIVFSTDCSM